MFFQWVREPDEEKLRLEKPRDILKRRLDMDLAPSRDTQTLFGVTGTSYIKEYWSQRRLSTPACGGCWDGRVGRP